MALGGLGSREIMLKMTAVNGMSGPMNAAADDLDRVNKHAASINVKLFAVGLTLSKVGRAFSNAGEKILGFGKDAVTAAVDYDNAMRRVATLTEIPLEAFPMLKKEILAMTREIPKSATELGDAMYYIASVIGEPQTALDLLEVSAKAATLALTDTEPVAKVLSAAMIAYKGTMEDATVWGDQLTKAVSLGRAEFEDFAAQVGSIIGMSNNLGVSFKELNIMMAWLTRRGYTASQASVLMRNSMMRIIKPSVEAKKAYQELGIEWGEKAVKAAGGLIPYLTRLGEAVNWNSDKLAVLFPNMRGLPMLLSLAKDAAGGAGSEIAWLSEQMGDTAGEIDSRFDIAMQGAGNQMQLLANMAEELKIAFGEALLPTIIKALDPIVDKLREVLEWFQKLPEEVKVNIAKWTMLGGVGLLVFGKIMTVLGSVLNLLALLELAGLNFAGVVGIIVSPFKALWGLVSGFIGYVAGGFASLYGIIKGIGGAFATFIMHPIQTIQTLWTGVVAAFSGAGGAMSGAFGGLLANLAAIIENLQQFGILNTIKILFGGIAQATLPVIAAVLGIVGAIQILVENWDKVKEAAGKVWGNLVEKMTPVIQSIKEAMIPLWEKLQDLWVQLQPVAKLLGAIILTVLVVALGLLTGIITGVMGALTGIIQVITGIVEVLAGVVEFLWGIGEAIIGVFKWIFSGFKDTSMIESAWVKIKEGFMKIVSGIVEIFKGLWNTVKGALTGFWDGIVAFFTGIYDTLVGNSIIPDMINDIIDWFLKLPKQVLTAINTFVTDIVAKFIAFAKRVLDLNAKIVNGVIEWFKKLPAKIVEAINSLISSVLTKFMEFHNKVMNIVKKFVNFGKAIVEGIQEGIKSAWARLVSKFKGLIDLLPAAVKKILGIKSPSKVFEQFGVQTMLGLVKGLASVDLKRELNFGEIQLKRQLATSLGVQLASMPNFNPSLMPAPVNVANYNPQPVVVIQFQDNSLRDLIKVQSQETVNNTFSDVNLQDRGR